MVNDIMVGFGATDMYSGVIAGTAATAARATLLTAVDGLSESIRATHGDIASLDAQASMAVNRSLANRIWVSGHGAWDRRGYDDGYSGYEYNARGGALGYDRLFGALLVGGSFACTSGKLNYDFLLATISGSIPTRQLFMAGIISLQDSRIPSSAATPTLKAVTGKPSSLPHV